MVCPECGKRDHQTGYIVCIDCGCELEEIHEYSSEDADEGDFDD